MTEPTTKQTCADLIRERFASREAQFEPLTAEVDDLDIETVTAFLDDRMSDWRPTRDEDESDEDYENRLDDEAREKLTEYRDERLDEEILAVDAQVTVTLRVELSTGGPADFLTADLDPTNGTLTDVTYHYQDWFDGATWHVPMASPLYDLMQRYADNFEYMADQTLRELL